MLTRFQKRRFERNGFLVVPAVFSRAQIRQLRGFLTELFAVRSPHEGDLDRKGDASPGVRFDVFARYPELSWVPTHPPVVAALRDLLGHDFVFLPETAAHDSGYGGWHKDTYAQERAGLRFHWEADHRMV